MENLSFTKPVLVPKRMGTAVIEYSAHTLRSGFGDAQVTMTKPLIFTFTVIYISL